MDKPRFTTTVTITKRVMGLTISVKSGLTTNAANELEAANITIDDTFRQMDDALSFKNTGHDGLRITANVIRR